jgi:hypothetical protein
VALCGQVKRQGRADKACGASDQNSCHGLKRRLY